MLDEIWGKVFIMNYIRKNSKKNEYTECISFTLFSDIFNILHGLRLTFGMKYDLVTGMISQKSVISQPYTFDKSFL